MNESMREAHEKLMNIYAREDKETSIIEFLRSDLYNALYWVSYSARTDEERALARECELRAVRYYQAALECNYDRLREYKETGDENVRGFWHLVLTVDADGKPRRACVTDVQRGNPILSDGCRAEDISSEKRQCDRLIGSLRRWMDYSGTLYDKLERALRLKEKGPLGISEPPAPIERADGMTREQAHANAWRSYAIENGMIGATHYDSTLDELILSLKKCIEFYEKATSIV